METKEENRLDFGDILGIGLLLVVTVIGLAYGASIVNDVRDSHYVLDGTTCNSTAGVYTNCNHAWNASNYGLTSLNTLGSKIPTIITVVVAAIIIGVLIRHLWVSRGAGGV